jgi:hypothetical protein
MEKEMKKVMWIVAVWVIAMIILALSLLKTEG